MDKKLLWEKAAAFHGHECPGLTIGYRASLYAIRLLDLTFSDDEQVVCIAENDACGCDAIFIKIIRYKKRSVCRKTMLRTKVNIEVERTLHCFPNARLLPYPFGKNQCADSINIEACIVEPRTDIVIGFQPPRFAWGWNVAARIKAL